MLMKGIRMQEAEYAVGWYKTKCLIYLDNLFKNKTLFKSYLFVIY